MRRLIHGVHEFQSQIFDTRRSLFERLAAGQHPEALFITCSDSRIDPNLLTQTAPGDLFVVRNAGNIVPPASAATGGEAATIEYAVKVLQVRDVVICGHSRCGAVAGLLSPDDLAELPLVAAWLDHAKAVAGTVEKKYAASSPEEKWARAVEENVLVQLDNLRSYPAVSAAVQAGKLNLHGWVYHFESGAVSAFDPVAAQFAPLAA